MVYVVRVEEPIDGPGEASFAFPDLKLLHSLVWACGEMWFHLERGISLGGPPLRIAIIGLKFGFVGGP